jgi:hypothetical protein
MAGLSSAANWSSPATAFSMRHRPRHRPVEPRVSCSYWRVQPPSLTRKRWFAVAEGGEDGVAEEIVGGMLPSRGVRRQRPDPHRPPLLRYRLRLPGRRGREDRPEHRPHQRRFRHRLHLRHDDDRAEHPERMGRDHTLMSRTRQTNSNWIDTMSRDAELFATRLERRCHSSVLEASRRR